MGHYFFSIFITENVGKSMDQNKNNKKDSSFIQLLPFQHLITEDQKDRIVQSSSLGEYSRKEIIFSQGSDVDNIAFILSGLVKISRELRKGKNIILRIAQPGTILGLSSVYTEETYNYSASAIENVLIGYVNKEAFSEIVKINGAFGFEITKQMGLDNAYNINRLSSLLYKQLPGRVSDIILYFAQEIFKSNTFNIPLTRQELAELAGTTKESLIRTLSEFNHDKIISLNRNTLSIISLNIIQTLSRLG